MGTAALAGSAQAVWFAGNSRRIVTDATQTPELKPLRIPLALAYSPAHTSPAVALAALLCDLARAGNPNPRRDYLVTRLHSSPATVARAMKQLTTGDGGFRPMITTRRRCRRSAVRTVIRALHETHLTVARWTFDLIEAGTITADEWRMYLWLTDWLAPVTGQVLYTQTEMAAKLAAHGITRTPAAISKLIAGCVRAGLVRRYERPGRSPILRPLGVIDAADRKPSTNGSPPPSCDTSPPPRCETSQVGTKTLTGTEPLTEDQKPLVLAVGQAEVVPREPRSRPAAPGGKPAPGVAAVVAALPAQITGQLRARYIPARITARITAALATRTPAELAARIDRRWHAHGYAAAADNARIADPAAVITALVRPGSCPDVRCEDGTVTDIGTGDGRPCGMCAQDAAGRRNQPSPVHTLPTPSPRPLLASQAAPAPAAAVADWRQPVHAAPKPGWARDWRRHRAELTGAGT